jgi:probable rRNA maturation factor
MALTITFNNQDIAFNLKHKNRLKNWLKDALKKEGKKADAINYIFCSDEYLLEYNRKYLQHNSYTDIITFDNSEKNQKGELILSGDIFISIDRVNENAKKYDVVFEEELRRILIHGVLHLAGYLDKNKKDKELMTKKEDEYLSSYKQSFAQ